MLYIIVVIIRNPRQLSVKVNHSSSEEAESVPLRNISIFIDTQGWQKKACVGASTSNASESESDYEDDDGNYISFR